MKAKRAAPVSAFLVCSMTMCVSAAVAQFTRYDKSLGPPQFDEIGDASFKGTIRVTGYLRIESDEVDYCRGACAYFIPDPASLLRLPRKLTSGSKTAVPIQAINLYEARPILVKALGQKQAQAILGPGLTIYQAPATITLKDFRVYGACDAIHYEAKVSVISVKHRLAHTSGRAELGGC